MATKNIRLKNKIEKQELLLKDQVLQAKLRVMESVNNINGTPVDWNELQQYRGQPLSPTFSRDNYQDRSTSVRTMTGLDLVRNRAKYLTETNPNCRGIIASLRSFVIGTGLKEKAISKKDGKNEALVDKVNKVLEAFNYENNLWEWYNELFTRSNVHGETFLRLFPSEDGITRIRAVEPDQIRPPQGEDHNREWSFGIKTAPGDTQFPVFYNIQIDGVDEQVEAQFIHAQKLNVPMNVKRGLSTLYPIFEELEGVSRLRYTARESEKVRQSIAYVREHVQADQSTVEALNNRLVTDQITRTSSTGAQRQVDIVNLEPGSVSDIPQSMKFQQGPKSPNSEAAVSSIRSALEACACRLCIPYWMVSGDANSGSYSSTLTAADPMVKRTAYLQRQNTNFWERLLRAIVSIAVEQMVLPKDTLEKVDIIVSAPSVLVRNKLDETTTNKILSDEGILSPQTWSTQSDLDYEAEQSKRVDAQKTMVVPPPKLETDNPTPEPATPSGDMQKNNNNPNDT